MSFCLELEIGRIRVVSLNLSFFLYPSIYPPFFSPRRRRSSTIAAAVVVIFKDQLVVNLAAPSHDCLHHPHQPWISSNLPSHRRSQRVVHSLTHSETESTSPTRSGRYTMLRNGYEMSCGPAETKPPPHGANAIADRRLVRIGRRFALQRLYLRYCFQ